MARILGIVLFAAVVTAAAPQGNSQGRGRGAAVTAPEIKVGGGGAKSSSVTFGEVDVRLIRDWFSQPANLKGLPPGLAKKEALPPGLEKQLQKNGTLPPGLQKNIQPLPPVLELQLMKLPEGQKRVVISGNIVLMNEKSGIVLDILFKVF
jgi:hypothetical protein